MRIFCEGDGDKNFIIQLLKHLEEEGELISKPEYSKYIFPKDCKTELLKVNNYNKEQKLIGKQIKKVLFIFDADFKDDNECDGLKDSVKCIEKLIEDLGWKDITSYYIFDKNLDDFIIKTLDEEQQECFHSFDECLEIEAKNKNKKISTCIYKKLYPQNPYDFSHSNFDTLKQKLTNLFNE
jgi:hypothetical protein